MSYTQYSQYGGNPYNNAPEEEAGYVAQPTNLEASQPQTQHELSNVSGTPQYSASATVHNGTLLSRQDFLTRVDLTKDQIRELTSSIQQISTLHQRALSSPDSTASAQLESLVTQTQMKNAQIRDNIKFLEADALKTQDNTKSMKSTQAKQLKNDFQRELKGYEQEEVQYRQRYREQIARQYRIVNPEASEEEVGEASNLDWGSEGVFQTALKSNRSGQASSVLGAVRARHNELQRIETTLMELAAMFADMAQLVEVQDASVERTEDNAIKTQEDVERGNKEISKANEHARRRNRLKWYCALIVFLIILAIALGIGLGVGLSKSK
ncbi:MAG: hypothetical protein M1818_004079 [Claussenomyces sp. TS43310]|nr:MAG: hypothetical protein M1818_004079 [Claussenomyces sp. TS43310]